ncbi:cyclin-F-like [Nyctibius grandis]|uniref:cyclin-F-like n=1 Tax=Nyctibius grandis TaxID=48427 RepID=UPI0035BC3A2E
MVICTRAELRWTEGKYLNWQVLLSLFHIIRSKIWTLIFLSSFDDDIPKDYRQVPLTAVKRRFEDVRYDQIGKEKIMSYIQLCLLLGVKQEHPEPSPLHANVEIQTFLSSPSGKSAKRTREDSIQDDRGSFVITPTAELSTQEESLPDTFLDWSLHSSSGYEGDQESEGEKDADVPSPSGILDTTVVSVDPAEHCGQDSSDEDSLAMERAGHAALPREAKLPDTRSLSAPLTPKNPTVEGSSGYSSISSANSTPSTEGSLTIPLKPTSALSPGSAPSKEPCLPHDPEPCLQSGCARPRDGTCAGRPVKRKNVAEHSEEREKSGSLSL